MKYLCLGYHDHAAWEAMSDGQRKALLEECVAYGNALRQSGHCLDSKALQADRNSTTLRFQNGRVSIIDGPVAAANEHLARVMVLEAKDLNHAIQLMSQLPCMRPGGWLEIRPINEDL
jgi:hypothetical protein